jgi:predicted ATPase
MQEGIVVKTPIKYVKEYVTREDDIPLATVDWVREIQQESRRNILDRLNNGLSGMTDELSSISETSTEAMTRLTCDLEALEGLYRADQEDVVNHLNRVRNDLLDRVEALNDKLDNEMKVEDMLRRIGYNGLLDVILEINASIDRSWTFRLERFIRKLLRLS